MDIGDFDPNEIEAATHRQHRGDELWLQELSGQLLEVTINDNKAFAQVVLLARNEYQLPVSDWLNDVAQLLQIRGLDEPESPLEIFENSQNAAPLDSVLGKALHGLATVAMDGLSFERNDPFLQSMRDVALADAITSGELSPAQQDALINLANGLLKNYVDDFVLPADAHPQLKEQIYKDVAENILEREAIQLHNVEVECLVMERVKQLLRTEIGEHDDSDVLAGSVLSLCLFEMGVIDELRLYAKTSHEETRTPREDLCRYAEVTYGLTAGALDKITEAAFEYLQEEGYIPQYE